jgi:hypothetical protein
VVATLTAAVETTIGEICYEPTGVAMSPDGRRALVTCGADPRVVELGGPFTLTIVKAGSGFGTVTSSPGGVLCGPACQARFDPGTVVTLAAVTDSNSRFDGWSGDCSADGSVSMTENRVCTATFTNPNLGGSGGGGGGGGGTGGGYGSSYGYCMAITALHGSDRAGDIELLRAFRDRRLLTHAAGRALVRAYWAVSPPIARALARHERLRAGARAALAPVVWAIERPRDLGLALGAAGGLLLLACRLGARRRS